MNQPNINKTILKLANIAKASLSMKKNELSHQLKADDFMVREFFHSERKLRYLLSVITIRQTIITRKTLITVHPRTNFFLYNHLIASSVASMIMKGKNKILRRIKTPQLSDR